MIGIKLHIATVVLSSLAAAPLRAQVPADAPDRIPAWVRHDSSLVTDVRAPALKFVKNVVLVKFKLAATQQERSATIGRVAGTVIGGNRFNVSGVYVIRLPADPTNDRVFEALRALRADTGVAGTDLFWFMNGVPDLTIVPPFAPDRVPSWVGHDSSLVNDARGLSPFSKNLVVVTFRPSTTQQERAAAIASIAGVVIGGTRLNDVDGLYVVQLPADPTNNRVFDALRVLNSNGISTADVYWFLIGAATSKPTEAVRTLQRHPAVRGASLKVVY